MTGVDERNRRWNAAVADRPQTFAYVCDEFSRESLRQTPPRRVPPSPHHARGWRQSHGAPGSRNRAHADLRQRQCDAGWDGPWLRSSRCQVGLTLVSVVVVQNSLPDDPLAALRVLADSEVQLDRMRRDRVIAARAGGASWQQVGDALGVSRQSAWEAFTADVSAALEASAANNNLDEDEAMDVAVSESRAARQSRRRST